MPRTLHTFGSYPSNWREIATQCKEQARWRCIRCDHRDDVHTGHVLTVHHLDGNKANCRWWNLLALCQRCHLRIQGRVNPDQPYMVEHANWFKPYVAGFYAWKYEGKELTRVQAEADLERLLRWERFM